MFPASGQRRNVTRTELRYYAMWSFEGIKCIKLSMLSKFHALCGSSVFLVVPAPSQGEESLEFFVRLVGQEKWG